MNGEELTELQEQVALLQQQLEIQQERSQEFRTQTINALEQAPIPDNSSSHRPAAFHGFDSEDINRWLDKVENYLKLRRINKATSTALAELVLNLAGPAEDFYYSLGEDRKDTFDHLRDAFRERFANENQTWIIWQAITTRQQGPVESLDTYLNDLTSKFRRINISDSDKMRYFVQGLRAQLKETVLLKQPKSFHEAEEMARLASTVKTTMNNSQETMTVQLNNLTKTLTSLAAGGTSQSNASQSYIQTQLKELTEKIDALATAQHKYEKVAAYTEPRYEEQRDFLQHLDNLSNKMESLSRRVDAQIDEVVRRGQQLSLRPRNRRPICFNCGVPGHYQYNCPHSEYYDSSYPEQSEERRPRYQAISSQPTSNQPNRMATITTEQREARSYYGSCLAIRSGVGRGTPVGLERRTRVAYLNAFSAVPGRKFPRGSLSQPRSAYAIPHVQRIRRAHPHVQHVPQQSPIVQVKQQEKLNLPETTAKVPKEMITVTVLQPNKGEKEAVKRKVTVSNKGQLLPRPAPQTGKPNIHKDSHSASHKQIPVKETTKEIEESDAIMISGNLDGRSVDFLLDSGACISTVTEKLVKKLYGNVYSTKVTDASVQSVKTINGSDVHLLGKIEENVELNGVLYPSQFHVMKNLSYEAILGRDFLCKYGAVLDLKNKYLTLGDKSLKLKQVPDGKSTIATYALRSSRNTTPSTPSVTQTGNKAHKKTQSTMFSGSRTTLQFRSKSGNWKSSIWILALIVMYMCVASRGQSLSKVQPSYKSIGNKPCYSQTDQVSLRTTKKSSMSSSEHDSMLIAKTYAHNRNHPDTSTGIKYKCHPLPTSQPNMLTQKIFKWSKDETLQEITTIRSNESTVQQNLRYMNSWHCNTLLCEEIF